MSDSLRKRAARWIGVAAACSLFGPFVIVYALGFIGQSPPENRFFGIWFMGALSIADLIATFDYVLSVRQHGWRELGCALPVAAFTCFIGYSFLKMIGLFE